MFDNSGKVYISIEDLAVRRKYVDPDRLLFMFGQPILIFKINDFFLSSSSNGGASYETYRNPPLLDRKSGVTTPKIRRYDQLSSVTVGRGVISVNFLLSIWTNPNSCKYLFARTLPISLDRGRPRNLTRAGVCKTLCPKHCLTLTLLDPNNACPRR